MKGILRAVGTLVVLGLLALLFPYTGLYNVSAAAGESDLMAWYLKTTSTRSIRARAQTVAVPTTLADSAAIGRGAVAFAEMCQTCHGAPGRERGVTGQGLSPTPPRLSETADEWSAGEVFWIVDQGIQMAGMPAYGPTHTDEALWEIVAFVKRLPETTPERYAALTAGGGAPPARGEADGSASAREAEPHGGHDHTH